MGNYSAQLDNNNIVKAIVDTTEPVTGANIIQIESFDRAICGKKYNADTQKFEDVVLSDSQLAEKQIQEEIKKIQAERESAIRDEAIANLTSSGKISVTDGVATVVK